MTIGDGANAVRAVRFDAPRLNPLRLKCRASIRLTGRPRENIVLSRRFHVPR